LRATLAKLGDELRFVLITSATTLAPLSSASVAKSTELDNLEVTITASEGAKCARCWHHREDVGTIAAHPELCHRCENNIEGDGEQRFYA
jgi:isoleucyl-tRNA synthetase